MAGSDAVLKALLPGVESSPRYPVLVPNLKGLEAAIKSGARDISVFTAASDAFNQKNINTDIAGSLQRIADIMHAARDANLRIRGYVSCVLGCPYQGNVDIADVVRVSLALQELGCSEVSLGDTIGVGTPQKARAMFKAVASELPVEQLAVHFHDTYGQALANVFACMEEGVRVVDSSVGGLGGCPYAKGASGNLASEDLLYMLNGIGMETGVNLDKVCETARWICAELGKEPQSKLSKIH